MNDVKSERQCTATYNTHRCILEDDHLDRYLTSMHKTVTEHEKHRLIVKWVVVRK